jgi:hypothetical protein
MKAIASSATTPSTIIQINVFEPPLSVVVVVVWLGREVCVVVVVVVVEEVLPDVCGDDADVPPPPVLEVFWASTGTATAQDRLRISRHALKLLNSRQDFIIINSPFRVGTNVLLTLGGGPCVNKEARCFYAKSEGTSMII